jgi:transposase
MPWEALAASSPVWAGEQPLRPIYREKADAQPELIAEGYEQQETLTAVVEGETVVWTERRLVIRSLKHAQAAERGLQDRATKAQAALAALNERGKGKRRFTEVAALRQAAEAIVARYHVQSIVQLDYVETVREHAVRR